MAIIRILGARQRLELELEPEGKINFHINDKGNCAAREEECGIHRKCGRK